MLTIILTSYNRPVFVEKAIKSVLAQTNDSWRLIIQDDGSEHETLRVLESLSDPRICLKTRKVSPQARHATTRYSSLINEALEWVDSGIVGYMCDNVEYDPYLVESIYHHFALYPKRVSGYVLHERDVWAEDGSERLGSAQDFNHWNRTPPIADGEYRHADGFLDHSQVFHRWPVQSRWETDISALKCGDGVFFNRLIAETGQPIGPISPGVVLSREHLFG